MKEEGVVRRIYRLIVFLREKTVARRASENATSHDIVQVSQDDAFSMRPRLSL